MIKKLFIFLIVTVFLTSCANSQKQQNVSEKIKPFDYGNYDEISLEQYDKVKNYYKELKKLAFNSGLDVVPSELINLKQQVDEVSKDDKIVRNEYKSLNIDKNLQDMRFLVAKLLKLQDMKK
ncbi:hypothetical protein CPG37_00510 [Malaciobacter canalis]|uniref:Lipoprotein n=1 Tax=Malaciobacter canalis TaxID=1912871 RepID=A0ABX4LT47_9BACT|nr:hypothetical protein [Malaciobacter canalis]PHO10963.1 hypothetical protein CPG37_00510 [Malaciobacter canalis]QEE33038.1 hypothetical protein ACAN_1562 [Malaciobacter canalis]